MRVLTSAVQTALAAEQLRTAVLIDLNFATPMYLWSGYGTLSYNSHTYVGSGLVLALDGVGETTDISSVNTNVKLSGLNAALVYKLLTENWQNRACVVRLALFDESNALIDAPIIVTQGRMDNAVIDDSGVESIVTFTIESNLADLEAPRNSRYSNSEQLLRDATDVGLSEIADTLPTRSSLVAKGRAQDADSENSRNFVYGTALIKGTLCYAIEAGGYYHYMYVLADHACNSFVQLYCDGSQVTLDGSGDATGDWSGIIHAETGLTGTATCVALETASSGEWSTSHKLTGLSWAYVRVVYNDTNFTNGVPDFTFVVQGKKLYDFRTSVSSFSANPAIAMIDFLKDTNYGMQSLDAEINYTAFETATDLCDEAVSLYAGGTVNRYTINGEFLTSDSPASILENIVGTCVGKLGYASGTYSLLAGGYVAPDVTFTDDDVVESVKITTKIGRADAYNAIRGTYANPTLNYTAYDYSAVVGATGITEDGGTTFWHDLILPYVNNPATARRIAKVYLERQRRRTSCEITVGARGLLTKIGDTITLTLTQFGWASKPFEVKALNIDFGSLDNPSLRVVLKLGQTDEFAYLWYTADENVLEITQDAVPTYTYELDYDAGTEDDIVLYEHQETYDYIKAYGSTANTDTYVSPESGETRAVYHTQELKVYGINSSELNLGYPVYETVRPTFTYSLNIAGGGRFICASGYDSAAWTISRLDTEEDPLGENLATQGIYQMTHEYSTDGTNWTVFATDDRSTLFGLGVPGGIVEGDDTRTPFGVLSHEYIPSSDLDLTGTIQFRSRTYAYLIVDVPYHMGARAEITPLSGTHTVTIS